MQRTELGIFLAKKRLDKGFTLKKMCGDIGVSAAFMSAVESGNRILSPRVVDRLAEIFGLNGEEKNGLVVLSNSSRKRMRYADLSKDERSIIHYFLEALKSLPEEDKKSLVEMLKSSEPNFFKFILQREKKSS
jgi:transcriptional regulator with XRE-family HTH domain